MKADRLVLDTSVIVEYLDEESPYATEVEKLYADISRGRVRAYVPATTLSEVLYVCARVYREAGVVDPNKEARRFITWLLSHSSVRVARPTLQISILAGELRKEMRISLPDCYVIATAKALRATPLFLKLEREMEPYASLLAEYNVRFLSEGGRSPLRP